MADKKSIVKQLSSPGTGEGCGKVLLCGDNKGSPGFNSGKESEVSDFLYVEKAGRLSLNVNLFDHHFHLNILNTFRSELYNYTTRTLRVYFTRWRGKMRLSEYLIKPDGQNEKKTKKVTWNELLSSLPSCYIITRPLDKRSTSAAAYLPQL